jgi:ABC-type lipoprotein export system ATPase subunit
MHQLYRRGKIEFKNVSFSHNQFVENTIKDISFTIKPGETVAIVGPSGSGKTTLLNLIGGLDTPSEGSVIIDNQDIIKRIIDNVFIGTEDKEIRKLIKYAKKSENNKGEEYLIRPFVKNNFSLKILLNENNFLLIK